MKNNLFAAVIVTFFPNNDIDQTLSHISDEVDRIIIIDNTPSKIHYSYSLKKNATIIFNGKNIGLSKALNIGVKIAGELGFENIFLLDQDTKLPDNYFFDMVHFKNKLVSKDPKFALFVPNFWDINSKSFARFPVLSKYSFFHLTCPFNRNIDYSKHALIAITSGTLLSYSNFLKIGSFHEDYFIDFIDNEYCLRANLNSFHCAVNCNILIEHSIGKRVKIKFWGINFHPNNHPPFRRFYIARNGVLTCLIYLKYYPSYTILVLLRMIHEFLSIILFENYKRVKVKALLKGIMIGIFNFKKFID